MIENVTQTFTTKIGVTHCRQVPQLAEHSAHLGLAKLDSPSPIRRGGREVRLTTLCILDNSQHQRLTTLEPPAWTSA